MNVKFDFTGKVIAISGAATGIGRATAIAFAKAGANVAVGDVDIEKGNETIQMVKDCGVKGLFVRLDVTSDEDVLKFKDEVLKEFGTVDFLFCNAGVGGKENGPPFTNIPASEFLRLINLNTLGMLRLVNAFMDTFKEKKFGKIVNTSSISAYQPSVIIPQYSMSKIAIINLTQALAKELGPYNVNVNVLNPGFVYTPIYEEGGMKIKSKNPAAFADCNTSKEVVQKMAQQSAFKRMQEPEDMANTVMFLCSEGAKEITGQTFNVDSGIIRR